MRHANLMFVWLLCLCAAGGAAYAETARDPFETKAAGEIPPNYEKAIQQVSVKGIVRAETGKRIIVGIAGLDGLTVLKPGEKVALDYNGRPHVFTVGNIGVKRVQFRAAPPASSKEAPDDAADYEVFVR